MLDDRLVASVVRQVDTPIRHVNIAVVVFFHDEPPIWFNVVDRLRRPPSKRARDVKRSRHYDSGAAPKMSKT